MRTWLQLVAFFFGCALFAWFCLADAVWQWRNPKANQMTIYTHIVDAMKFRKVPEFQ